MKPHPRIRKTIKWGGAVVTVLLVVVWIGTGWFTATYFGLNWAFSIQPGKMIIHHDWDYDRGLVGQVRVETRPSSLPFEWWFDRSGPSNATSFWSIPMWTVVIAFSAAAFTAWRLDTLARRRARLNLCPTCNYDRTGLASKDAKCPECGSGKEPL